MTSSPTPEAAASAASITTFRWAPWWVLLQVLLWPAPGIAEGVLTLGALAAVFVLLKQRFRGGGTLLTAEAWALSTAMFLAYWLPQLFSAWDAVNLPRTVREVIVDLRYLPFLWLVAMAVADTRGRRLTIGGIGVIVLAWLADGLLQAATGWSLGGGSHPDRLSGIFGATNLKLGLVMASLSPFALMFVARRFGVLGWAVVAAGLVIVVLLAGARASWLTLALSLLVTGVWVMGLKRALLAVALGSVVLVGTATVFSERMGQRVERTQAALSGDAEGVDFALSGRLPIWRTAWAMAQDNWVTGVGARGFRDAYGDYAAEDDPWMQGEWQGAFHAHQLVLELLSETGVVGLALWLMAAAMVLRAWRWASPEARLASRVPALALAITLFPLNTHLAFYSTFWGGLALLLAALCVGSLGATKHARDEEPVTLADDVNRSTVRPAADA